MLLTIALSCAIWILSLYKLGCFLGHRLSMQSQPVAIKAQEDDRP